MRRDTCGCGRYEWPDHHCLDGAHRCPHCGLPISANATDHGDEPRTYWLDTLGIVHTTGGYDGVDSLENIAATPVTMRPSEACALPEFDGL